MIVRIDMVLAGKKILLAKQFALLKGANLSMQLFGTLVEITIVVGVAIGTLKEDILSTLNTSNLTFFFKFEFLFF